jgi:hypothetical protein
MMRFPVCSGVVRLVALAFGVFCANLQATTVLLNFSGLQNGEAPLSFYLGGGGAGSLGSTGSAFGIVFEDGIASIDSDFGGTGNFANAPSPSTILTAGQNPITMTVLSGFRNVLSFWYVLSSSSDPALVLVFSGNDLLTSMVLEPPTSLCPGDPNGSLFGCWQQALLPFAGIATSAVFFGGENQFGIDDIRLTLDSQEIISNLDEEGVVIDGLSSADVPEPGTWALAAAGVAALVLNRHRFRRS